MAITHIGTALDPNPGISDNIVLSKPAGTQRGDLMLVCMFVSVSQNLATTPAGWNLWIDGIKNMHFYYKFAGDSEPASWTWTWISGDNYGGPAGVSVFRGISTEHAHPFSQNYDSTPPAAPVTSVFGTINAGRQALYIIALTAQVNFGNVSFPWPAGSGYTSLFNDDNDPGDATGGYRAAMAWKIGSASEVPAGTSMTSDSLPATVNWNSAFGYFVAKNNRQNVF